MPKLVESSPCFLVKDVVAASGYYVDKLGFTLPRLWGEPPSFAMPHRDGYIVMLNQVDRLSPQPNGREGVWDAYFWCTGVDELFEEVRAAGASIVHEPCNQDEYGMREFSVQDLDGYLLAFAEDLHPDG